MNIEKYEIDLSDEEKIDLAVIRSARSGEMHSMFAVCRKYNMTVDQWDERYGKVKKNLLYLQKLRSIADNQLGK